jgi:hypothetical protein
VTISVFPPTQCTYVSAKDSLGYYELKEHKPLFNEGCTKLLDQRKQAKLQWLQDPSKMYGDNLNKKPGEILGIKRGNI